MERYEGGYKTCFVGSYLGNEWSVTRDGVAKGLEGRDAEERGVA